MLSTTVEPSDGIPVGKHPLVIKLLKACYNKKPPQPRYALTWDVDIVLWFISGLGANGDLPLATLVRKTSMLLALATLMRVMELASISLSSIKFTESQVAFSISRPRKAQYNGPLHSFSLSKIPEETVCPVEALKSYIE